MSQDFEDSEINGSQFKEKQDDIFHKLCAPEEYQKNTECLVDSVEFSTFSQKRNCQFCGYIVCNNCSQKKRENPEKKGEFVRICDLCDVKYLRRAIMQEDKQEQKEIDQEIGGYERALQELNNDYKQILTDAQQNKNEETEINYNFGEELSEKNSYITKLQKELAKLEEQLKDHKDQEEQLETNIEGVQNDIKDIEFKLAEKKKKHEFRQKKIREYDDKIEQLQLWLAQTNKDVSNWAITNKKFESFRKTKGKNSSIWKEPIQNTVDYNDNEIFRHLYTDSDDDEDALNSQQINQLLQQN